MEPKITDYQIISTLRFTSLIRMIVASLQETRKI